MGACEDYGNDSYEWGHDCRDAGAYGVRGGAVAQAVREPDDYAYRDEGPGPQAVPRLRIDDLSTRELGEEGERLAVVYLRQRGFEIVERNWECPYGEADIIARDGTTCVFIEVKTRLALWGHDAGEPEHAVTGAKRSRYGRIAQCYLEEHQHDDVRFDVIAVSIVAQRTAQLRHYVGAFECDL